MKLSIWLFTVILQGWLDPSQATCPTLPVLTDFNLTSYISAPWYIQYQQPTPYLQVSDNYCVRASYQLSKRHVPGFHGTVLDVANYANHDRVNGHSVSSRNTTLCARLPDPHQPSHSLVAPCWLPNLLGGDYWVVAAGPEPTNYTWAVVSGGPLTQQYADGCTTPTDRVNGGGFWIFTRDPVPDQALVAQVLAQAQQLGFTLDLLHPVTQVGCRYV